jgi:protoporphyrinogen/coproporphyrinogen III oxidase
MRRIAIVGGGISGLTAAYELARQARGGAQVEAVLFESTQRLGGLIETINEGGFTVECGPDGWVSAKPWARELAIELGLGDDLIPSNDLMRRTWILLKSSETPPGTLVPMPDGFSMMVPSDLGALDRSPLFTDAAIAAYRREPGRATELRAATPGQDESVAEFVLRHFGPEVLDHVAAPLLSGIFGGDVRRLSVRAVMPTFVEMEREYGSLIVALEAKQSRSRQESLFTTLRPGLGLLIQRLEAEIPPHWIRRNYSVTGLRHNTQPSAPAWTLHTSTTGKHHGSDTFDAVFLAAPLDSTRRLLAQLDQSAATLLPTESSSAVLVAFCYPDAARVPLPQGFGFLVPPSFDSEQALDPSASLLLACTFVDQKFAGRVPPNGRMVRAFFGGAAADRVARCNNDEIAAIARLELARVLQTAKSMSGIAPAPAPPPVLTVVRRWPHSLPQYAVGHLDRAAELEQRLAGFSGLTLLGNSVNGVGLPDLIRDARAAAKATSAMP